MAEILTHFGNFVMLNGNFKLAQKRLDEAVAFALEKAEEIKMKAAKE